METNNNSTNPTTNGIDELSNTSIMDNELDGLGSESSSRVGEGAEHHAQALTSKLKSYVAGLAMTVGTLFGGATLVSCDPDEPTPEPIEKPVVDTTPKLGALETKVYDGGTVKMQTIVQKDVKGVEHTYKALESFEMVPNISDKLADLWNKQHAASGVQFANGAEFEQFFQQAYPIPGGSTSGVYGAGETNNQVAKYIWYGVNGDAPDAAMMNKLLWREKVYTIADIKEMMGAEKFDAVFKTKTVGDKDYLVFTSSDGYQIFEGFSTITLSKNGKPFILNIEIRSKEDGTFYINLKAR